MSATKSHVQISKGYYLDDCDCTLCEYYGSKSRKCKIPICCCAEEKWDAVANNRLVREQGVMA